MAVPLATLALLVSEVLCSPGFTVPQVQVRSTSSKRTSNSGPAALARAYAKYGMPISNTLTKRATAQLNSQTGSTSANIVDSGIMLASPVTIGGQTFNLQLDTGSTDLWLYSTFTPEELRGANRHVYDPSLSSTAQPIANETFAASYGSGSASGIAYNETVTIGDLTVDSQTIGLVTNASESFYDIPEIDGILGLSHYAAGTHFTPTKYPIFLDSVLSSLTEPLFTAEFNLATPGTFTFGYIPPSYPASSLTWVPSSTSWSVPVSGWAIGNSSLTTVSWSPILDTGTPFILLSPDIAVSYYETAGPMSTGTYVNGENGFTYLCNGTLPDLWLRIGGYTARISGEQLSGPPVGTDGYCWGKVQPIACPVCPPAVLGDTFLQSSFTVFKLPVNGSTPIVGFAAKNASG